MRLISASIVAGLAAALCASAASAAPLLAIDAGNGAVQSGFTAFTTGETAGSYTHPPFNVVVKTLTKVVGAYTVTFATTNNFTADDRSGYGYSAVDKNLLNDELVLANYGQDGTVYDGLTFQIDGLGANTAYSFTIYDVSFGNSVNTTWTPFIGTGSAVTIVNAGLWYGDPAPYQGTATWTTDAAGTIAFGSDHGAGVATRINGFTVTAVPEPAAISLLGLSGLAILRRRR